MQEHTTLRRTPDVIATEVDGMTLMMHIETGKYHGLNAVGRHIWDRLDCPQTVETLAASVEATFEVPDGQTAKSDVLTFLTTLIDSKLVQIESAAP